MKEGIIILRKLVTLFLTITVLLCGCQSAAPSDITSIDSDIENADCSFDYQTITSVKFQHFANEYGLAYSTVEGGYSSLVPFDKNIADISTSSDGKATLITTYHDNKVVSMQFLLPHDVYETLMSEYRE